MAERVLMDGNDKQDVFIEKFVTFRKLVSAVRLQQAKTRMAADPGKSLLQVLLDLGLITAEDAKTILQSYDRSLGAPPRDMVATTEPCAPETAPQADSSGDPPSADAVVAPVPQIPDADVDRILGFTHLHDYLGYAREVGASDLHISVASPAVVRKNGRLLPLPGKSLGPEETERLIFQILTEAQQRTLRDHTALDFCYHAPDGHRYRTCMLRQRTGWDAALRIIQSRVPTCEELALPAQVRRLTEYNQGLVLVTGPNGCGKSTTMAAMLEFINQHRSEHIITIEDPVEYLFVPAASQINQRQVLTHTRSFAAALRAALREDPDVIMIGELRDRETVSLAITAAETGHLVFGTMHTTSAARTIDRILDVFPPDEQPQIRSMISESIRGIVCQQLIPRRDGCGRALALEILTNTPAVANLIRERKLFQIPSIIQTSRQQGMLLLDNTLLELANAGVIDGVEAFYAADDKTHFTQWAPTIDGLAAEG